MFVLLFDWINKSRRFSECFNEVLSLNTSTVLVNIKVHVILS